MSTFDSGTEGEAVSAVRREQPVSVIIVTFNGLRYLEPLRAALQPQIRADDEVIILDNASTDGTPAWIARHWPEAHLIESDRNLLFAAGNNRATRAAKGDVLLYLNQDAMPSDAFVAVAAERTHARRALTFGQVLPFASEPLIPYLDWSGITLWRTPVKAQEATNMLSGAAFSLHRASLELVTGQPFDPRIPHYCEDTNLSLKLADQGVVLLAVSDVYVDHDSHPSKGSPSKDFQRAILIGRNRILAYIYALGWRRGLAHLPRLMAAGVRKANVDGMSTPLRVAGLTIATLIGYLLALVSRPRGTHD